MALVFASFVSQISVHFEVEPLLIAQPSVSDDENKYSLEGKNVCSPKDSLLLLDVLKSTTSTIQYNN